MEIDNRAINSWTTVFITFIDRFLGLDGAFFRIGEGKPIKRCLLASLRCGVIIDGANEYLKKIFIVR